MKNLTTYYGISNPGIEEFLATLGLRTHSGRGTDKPAFITLKKETKRRGW